MPQALCLCALVSRLESATRLVLVINAREGRKRTNTGLLAARCLAGSEVHTVGSREHPVDFTRLAPAQTRNLLLFPAPDAVLLGNLPPSSLPTRLIVPDGDWGQAGRIRRKFADDAPLTCVALPDGAPTAYTLRRTRRPVPGGLATIEAIARAMGILDGAAVEAALLGVFREFHARMLQARGVTG